MAEPESRVAGLPLTLLGEGDSATVTGVRGPAEARQRMAELGFVDGAVVTVVSRARGGIVASVKGSRLALGAQMAGRVTVAP